MKAWEECDSQGLCTYLLHILAFGDKLIADFDSGVAEGFEQVSRVQTLEVGGLVSNCRDTIQTSSMAYCGPTTPRGGVRRESLLCGVWFVCPSDAQV